MNAPYSKLALCLATLTLVTACNQKPKTDTATTSADSTTQVTTSTTTTVTAVSGVAATSEVAPTLVASGTSAIAPTAMTETTASTTATTPATISPEKAGLAKDLVAFNNGINAALAKSQKMQADFIQKHKDDKSPDVQVLFVKEGIKSLDQQKADLLAVKLTDPKSSRYGISLLALLTNKNRLTPLWSIPQNRPKPNKMTLPKKWQRFKKRVKRLSKPF